MSSQQSLCTHAVLLFLLACLTSGVRAESVVVYPVQSGLIDDGSCCSPYAYSNSSSQMLSLGGCFSDPHYGCWNDRERGAWRWDLEGVLPATAVVTSAHIHWSHPNLCDAWSVYLWIDAGTQTLSSSYCQQIRNNPDQQYSEQEYYASTYAWSLDETVIDQALSGGYLSLVNQIGSGGLGCDLWSLGDEGVRIVIDYDIVTCAGDFNQNGAVDVDDLLILISSYNTEDADHDLDGDEWISVNDVLILLSQYGECA